MAICAKEMMKPFYVLTESFKFTRLYPLNQRDLPNEFKVVAAFPLNIYPCLLRIMKLFLNYTWFIYLLQYTSGHLKKDLSKEHPLVDYTPPSYITLLFTDLGILTPSAVSDELIKLYLWNVSYSCYSDCKAVLLVMEPSTKYETETNLNRTFTKIESGKIFELI